MIGLDDILEFGMDGMGAISSFYENTMHAMILWSYKKGEYK